MFVIKTVRFKKLFDNGVVFVPTYKTNVKEFISFEAETNETDYISSVNVMMNSFEINLRLSKNFFELDKSLLYDVYISALRLDRKTNKLLYKVNKIIISEEIVSTTENEEDLEVEDLLDTYEIKELFAKQMEELESNLTAMQSYVDDVREKVKDMDINIENMNSIAEINNNFDRNILKNYI